MMFYLKESHRYLTLVGTNINHKTLAFLLGMNRRERDLQHKSHKKKIC